MFLNGVQGRRLRRGYPIVGYVGPNGSGKTLAAVFDCLPSLAAGRPVLSTVRLLDYENPRPCDDPACTSPNHGRHMAAHPYWRPFTVWRQLLDAEGVDVLADEITGIASSRESMGLPAAIANTLVQLRRRDVVLRWTAPAWARADLLIRECSQACVVASGFLPVKVASSEGDLERVWRRNRAFRWVTYDAAVMTDYSEGKREKLRKLDFSMMWGPGSDAFAAYDTFDSVSSVSTVSDSGRCLDCGGRRTVPACTCADYAGARPRAAVGARGGRGVSAREVSAVVDTVAVDVNISGPGTPSQVPGPATPELLGARNDFDFQRT